VISGQETNDAPSTLPEIKPPSGQQPISPSKPLGLSDEVTSFFNQKQEDLRNLTAQVSNPCGKTDRLIHSITMIKEVLQSNMTLREDLLKVQQAHDRLHSENFQ